jgi:hypothetical protein
VVKGGPDGADHSRDTLARLVGLCAEPDDGDDSADCRVGISMSIGNDRGV